MDLAADLYSARITRARAAQRRCRAVLDQPPFCRAFPAMRTLCALVAGSAARLPRYAASAPAGCRAARTYRRITVLLPCATRARSMGQTRCQLSHLFCPAALSPCNALTLYAFTAAHSHRTVTSARTCYLLCARSRAVRHNARPRLPFSRAPPPSCATQTLFCDSPFCAPFLAAFSANSDAAAILYALHIGCARVRRCAVANATLAQPYTSCFWLHLLLDRAAALRRLLARTACRAFLCSPLRTSFYAVPTALHVPFGSRVPLWNAYHLPRTLPTVPPSSTITNRGTWLYTHIRTTCRRAWRRVGCCAKCARAAYRGCFYFLIAATALVACRCTCCASL